MAAFVVPDADLVRGGRCARTSAGHWAEAASARGGAGAVRYVAVIIRGVPRRGGGGAQPRP